MSAIALRQGPSIIEQDVAPGEMIALEVFQRLDRLPSTYFVHLAQDDRNAPMIRDGEIVVVDQGGATQGGWYPTEGGLFVIEHRSEPDGIWRYPRVSRRIVQTYEGKDGWYAGVLRRGRYGNRVICSDGPYVSEQVLADCLIGKVIGLYAPIAGEVLQ